MHKVTFKTRPLRVFYDVQKKNFYIIKSGKKTFIKLPASIKTLAAAQKYIGDKFNANVTIQESNHVNPVRYVEYEKPVTKRDKDLYKAFRENSGKYGAIDPRIETPALKEEYDLEQARLAKEAEEKAAREAEVIRAAQENIDRTAALNLLNNIMAEAKNTTGELALTRSENDKLQKITQQLAQDQIGETQLTRRELTKLITDETKLLEQIRNNQLVAPVNPPVINPLPPQPVPIPLPPPQPIIPQPIIPQPVSQPMPIPQPENKIASRHDDLVEFKRKIDQGVLPNVMGVNFSDFGNLDKWNSYSNGLDVLKEFTDYLLDPINKSDTAKIYHSKLPTRGPRYKGPPPLTSQIDQTKFIIKHMTPKEYQSYWTTKDLNLPDLIARQSGNGAILPALWNDQIEDFFEGNPEFGGVISSDEINDLPNKIPMGFIMNLSPSNEEGSHWVACYITGDSVEYFDPFAEPPSDDFKKQITKKIKDMKIPVMLKFKINKIKQQHGNSFRCGYHSIRFLDDRMNGIEFPMASRFGGKLDNSKEGEKKVLEEFSLI